MLVRPRHAVAVLLLSLLSTAPAMAQTLDLGICEPVASRVADTWLRGLPWDSAAVRTAAATCGRTDATGGVIASAMIDVMESRGDDALRRLAPILRSATPPAASRYVECLALGRLRRNEEALAACNAALARRAGWLVPELPRGRVLAALERYEDAAAALRRGLGAVPQSYEDWDWLAFAERKAGRTQAALTALEEAYRRVPPPLAEWRAEVAMSLAGWLADSLQQTDRAVQVLDDALRRDSTNARLLQARAGIEFNRGRRGEARIYIDRILARDPGNANALNSRGMLRALDGDRAGAAQDFLAAAKDSTDVGPFALFNLAALHRDAGRRADAENAVVEALLRRPEEAAYFAAVPTFVKDSARQLVVYDRVLARVSSSPARLARLRLPDAVLPPARKVEDAIVLAADSTLASPDKGFVIESHARLLAQVGRLREAIPAFSRMARFADEFEDVADAAFVRSMALGARALIRTELGDIPGGIMDLRSAENAQLAYFTAQGDSAVVSAKYAPLLRLPGASLMRDSERSAGRTATAVGLALLQRGELEGLTWLMRGRPDSASVEQFATIVQQRGLPLATLVDRVPLPPADSLGFRFNHIYQSYGSGSRVFITDGRPESFYVIGDAAVRGDLEQDVPLESSAFAPRSPAWAVRWWHANAGARYLQRAAFRQRNAEVFLKASRLKRTVRGGAVTVVGDGDVRDPEVERWLQRAYGLPIGTPLYLCAPSSGAVMTLRLGYRDPNGPIDRRPRGFELQFRHRGKTQLPNEFTPIRLDVQTGRLLVYRRDNPSGSPSGNPYLVLDPSGQPGQGGTLTSANFGVFRASSCPAQ